jgi:uncharacterized protein with HEPN domain
MMPSTSDPELLRDTLSNIMDHLLDIDLADEYPEVDWKGVKGIRDFLSHHYFVLDAEVIFDVCRNKIDGLADAIDSLDASLYGDARSPER